MMGADFVSNQEIIVEARRRLDQNAWNYLSGGAESETTMLRNRLGFDRIALRPRVLADVSTVDTSTEFLGHRLRIPVLLAPIGSLQTLTPEGGAAVAKAAAEFGTVNFVSSVTQPSLEEISAASPSPKVFQLYVQGDMDWVRQILGRVKRAGYRALCLTVDTAYYGRRERQMRGRWLPPSRRLSGYEYRARLTWETMDVIKEIGELPFILKGVATAEDAAIAVEHGVDAIYVSNHGGRQLDHGRATIEMLPEIVAAAGGKAEIVLDGGIVRGTDVLKAIALGAKAVAIGKLQGWGLGAAGQAGLVRVLELLEDELKVAMGLLGVTRLNQLDRSFLSEAKSPAVPHEMSAFPHLPGGRLL
ncbi:MAG TPA: alpha-hydroxy acid oxidase [candidate division Zixibacteria bacterium]|nr:alpha-hydroxy acid oxidase [candidate division Zixibacteria bacterium]